MKYNYSLSDSNRASATKITAFGLHTLRAVTLSLLLTSPIFAVPSTLHAQRSEKASEKGPEKAPEKTSEKTQQGTGAAGANTTSQNVCISITNSLPSALNSPERIAWMRLQWEVDSAARILRSAQLQQDAARKSVEAAKRQAEAIRKEIENNRIRIEELRLKETDSLLLKLSEQNRRLSSPQFMTGLLKGDSIYGFFGGIRTSGDSILRFFSGDSIRALQPRISSILAEASRFRSASPLDGGPGYIGISTSGALVRVLTRDGMLVNHCDYPVVEAVDAGSPAQRAGVARGDTLLAYNGQDVMRNAVNYSTLLTPGSDVRIKLQNNGRTREATVHVVEPKVATGRVMLATGAGVVQGLSLSPSSSVVSFAGAQLVTMDADLAKALGLGPGVLALRVPTGTTAASAGLRTGDVVRSVNGEPVRDAVSLERLLIAWTNGGGTQARLVVQSRTGGERTIVMKLR